MKKLVSIIIAVFAAFSCDLYERLDNLETRVTALEELCTQFNQDISSMKSLVEAMQGGDYITDVRPVIENGQTVGYTIVFAKHGSVTITNGRDGEKGDPGDKGNPGDKGEDGVSPVVGVKKGSDGVYYWTLNGEWLLDDNGNRIPVSGTDGSNGADGQDGADGQNGSDGKDGITPQLKIEEGYWYISYDNGKTWAQLGKATGDNGQDGTDGADGDSFFSDVIAGDTHVTIVLKDGTSFTIPMAPKTVISFTTVDGEAPVVVPGSTLTIGYELVNATETTIVSASSDGYYKVKVEKNNTNAGTIYVETPDPYTDGFITVHVSDGGSFSFDKVINFYEGKMNFPDGLEYAVPCTGGDVTVDFSANFEYTASVDRTAQSWLSIVPSTKAEMKAGSITLSVKANVGNMARSGKILLYGPEQELYAELKVNQASSVFSMEEDSFTVPAEGGTVTAGLTSSLGAKAQPEAGTDWITVTVTEDGAGKYILTAEVSPNEGTSYRQAEISITDNTGEHVLGVLTVSQLPSMQEKDKAMIFEVRANFSNDFTVILPVSTGTVDAYIDWGDGNIEHYERKGKFDKISHRYETGEVPTTYTVTITGKLNELRGPGNNAIVKVVQWGQTGLVSIQDAFRDNDELVSIPADNAYSFTDLRSIYNAFAGCSGLSSIPEGLFTYATGITSADGVFSGCTGLTEIPAGLFANCTEIVDFGSAFKGCTGLERIPAGLFAACTKATDLNLVFAGCAGLSEIPALIFAENVSAETFYEAFSGCTGLTSIPETLFAACTLATDFTSAFNGCTGIVSVPSGLFAACTEAVKFESVFRGCSGLSSIPGGLFASNTKAVSFESVFSGCTSLGSVPEDLFSKNRIVTDFSGAFSGCTGLTAVPSGLFDNNRRVTDFTGTFRGCVNLEGESPYTVIDGTKYHLYERYKNTDQFVTPTGTNGCFYNCLKLSDYLPIPLDWKQ